MNTNYTHFKGYTDEYDGQLTEEQYRIQARRKYKNLFDELERRSVRAAKMHYRLADGRDRMAILLDYALFISGVTIGTTWLLVNFIALFYEFNTNGNNIANIAKCVILLVSVLTIKGTIRPIPIFRTNEKVNIDAAAGWQLLELKIRSYKIQLLDPNTTVKQFAEWWNQIIEERRRLCLVQIPEEVYNEFSTVH